MEVSQSQVALCRWREGEEAVRRVRAPLQMKRESNMLCALEGALLGNIAQASAVSVSFASV
eukprot:3275463-Amphidinium_carterae.1